MVGAYKLIFDLCLYYSLSGFYTTLLYHSPPSLLGFGLLCLSVILERITHQRGKKAPALRFVLMALPAAALFSGPAAASAVQWIPGWIYVIYCVQTDRTGVAYSRFQEQFRFALLLLAAVLPGFVISQDAGAALETVIPFMTLMLVSGVFLMRILRKGAENDLKQLLPLAAVVGVCTLLTVAHIPQGMGTALSWLYQNGILWLLEGLIFLFCQLLNILYIVLKWVLALFGRELKNPLQPQQQQNAQEDSQQEALFPDAVKENAFVQALFTIAVAILLVWAFIKLFQRLRGYQMPAEKKAVYTDQRQCVCAKAQPKRGILRPRDPRLAVRFYYAKFLQECRRRGMTVNPGCTSEELAAQSAEFFPGTDPAALRELYAAARYWETGAVSSAQADRAAACWRSLKKTKIPDSGK